MEDVAHALDVVAAVAVVRGLVGLCQVFVQRLYHKRHFDVPDMMQGVRPIQTRSVFRPFMSQILVTSFVLYYYIGLAHSCHLYCTLKYSYICLKPNSASASLLSLRTKFPFIF